MPKPELSDKVMPFGDHLEELRSRLAFALLGLLPILIIALAVGKKILGILFKPVYEALLKGDQAPGLLAANPFEGFSAYVKVSLVLTIIVGAPWIIYHLWRFVAPGLYAHERRFAYLLAPLSAVLTLFSGVFLYYLMLPVVLFFFVQFNASLPGIEVTTAPLDPGVTLSPVPILAADPAEPAPGTMWYNSKFHQLRLCVPGKDGAPLVLGTWLASDSLVTQQYRIADTVAVILNLAIALAIAFQMPVVVLLLGWAGLVTPVWLSKYRRHSVMVCAVRGAVLTPADPVSMVILAIPLYLLFELGVFLLRALPAGRVAGDATGKSEHDTGGDDPFARPDDQ